MHHTTTRPTYQPPPPVKSSYSQPEPANYSSPQHQSYNATQTQHNPSPGAGRFDPQAILEKQRAKSSPYREPEPQMHSQQMHSQQTHSQLPPQVASYGNPTGVHSVRDPSHQPRPLTTNTSSNKPGGPEARVENRPFQSSWNPHPKKLTESESAPRPGTVNSRIQKFTNSAGGAYTQPSLQSHRTSPPPPTDGYAPPGEDLKVANKGRNESGGSRKDVVATARGVLEGWARSLKTF